MNDTVMLISIQILIIYFGVYLNYRLDKMEDILKDIQSSLDKVKSK